MFKKIRQDNSFFQPRLLIVLFFVLYLAAGLLSYRDYGVACDEPFERYHGIVTLKYLSQQALEPLWPAKVAELANRWPEIKAAPPLQYYQDKNYGSLYSLSLYLLEKIFSLDGGQAGIYYLRHLVNFLLFEIGLIFLYLIAAKRWQDWKVGLLAAAMTALNPRFFAESFYNNKDIAFLSFFIIALYWLQRFWLKKNYRTAVIAGFFAAIASSLRLSGLLLPLLGTLFFCPKITGRRLSFNLEKIKLSAAYLASTSAFLILFWPWLWSSPLNRLIAAGQEMLHYGADKQYLNFYLGQILSSQHLPWHYLPVWIAITVPIAFLVLFILGLWRLANGYFQKIKTAAAEQSDFDGLIIALFFVPLFLTIIFRVWLYDGWRQMYFLYVPLVLIAAGGWKQMIIFFQSKARGQYAAWIFSAIIIMSLAYNAAWIFKNHPYQYSYFNLLAPSPAANFDLDYWALSYRQALEYLAGHAAKKPIKIYLDYVFGGNSLIMLPESDRNRFVLTSQPEADYIITGRFSEANYQASDQVRSFSSGQTEILRIYDNHQHCSN